RLRSPRSRDERPPLIRLPQGSRCRGLAAAISPGSPTAGCGTVAGTDALERPTLWVVPVALEKCLYRNVRCLFEPTTYQTGASLILSAKFFFAKIPQSEHRPSAQGRSLG